MNVWVYIKRKEEEHRIEKTVGTGTMCLVIKKGRSRWFGHMERKTSLFGD